MLAVKNLINAVFVSTIPSSHEIINITLGYHFSFSFQTRVSMDLGERPQFAQWGEVGHCDLHEVDDML